MDHTWNALCITGADVIPFLNNLFSNDIKDTPCYGAFLDTKGRVISDAFILPRKTPIIVAPTQRLQNLTQHLSHQALFTQLSITQAPEVIFRTQDALSTPPQTLVSFADPRTPLLGFWHIAPHQDSAQPCENITCKRLQLGIAEGENIPAAKGFALHYNLHNLNGISFKKGCYLGQELITRTWHLGVLRKNVIPCITDCALPHGEALFNQKKELLGHMLQSHTNFGLALCNTEAFGTTLCTENHHKVHCGHPFKA